ncbi:MAG TPA: hypothetical protein VGA55_01250, partial [Bacteroidota bacterium]
ADRSADEAEMIGHRTCRAYERAFSGCFVMMETIRWPLFRSNAAMVRPTFPAPMSETLRDLGLRDNQGS